MVRAKLSKRAQDVIDFGPLIKLCLIQRLTTHQCLALFEQNGQQITSKSGAPLETFKSALESFFHLSLT